MLDNLFTKVFFYLIFFALWFGFMDWVEKTSPVIHTLICVLGFTWLVIDGARWVWSKRYQG